jgi:hypothetical protein
MKTIVRSLLVSCFSFVLVFNSFAQNKPQSRTCGEAYYVSFQGLQEVDISDNLGGKLVKYPGFLDVRSLKGLGDYSATGENSIFLSFAALSTNYIDFQMPEPGLGIEVVKGCGNAVPNMAVRFNDVSIPANAKVRLTLSPKGVSDLIYDKDGDGTFESVWKATARVFGKKAEDTDSPALRINIEHRGVYALVTITAEDVSGVKEIRYSLDGKIFKPYTEPFQIQYTVNQVTIYALAEDNIGLRSLDSKKFRFVPEKRNTLTNLPF